nr:DNA-formamidopyrimidine glycosylase family protein [Sneathiella glossodoripedis]
MAISLRKSPLTADLRFPFAPDFCEKLSHKEIKSISRRAKYILMTLSDGTVMIGHLGMSGSFRIEPKGGDSLIAMTILSL